MTSNDQARKVQVLFRDENAFLTGEELLVTPMAPNVYRMEESSIMGGINYHDIVETEPQPDGSVVFLHVLIPSELKTASWVLSPAQFESPALSALLDEVGTVGGNWERIFGGVLLLHLPAAEHDHIVNAMKRIFERPSGKASNH